MKTLLTILVLISLSVNAQDVEQMDYSTLGKCQAYSDLMEIRGIIETLPEDALSQSDALFNRYWSMTSDQREETRIDKQWTYIKFLSEENVAVLFQAECM